jgi:hypothetical protein
MSAFGHFPSDKVLDGFDCHEEGCEQLLSPTTIEEVTLSRTDLGDPIPSIVCPACRRVYSGASGMPLVFEHTKKMFYIDGQQVVRPLSCRERLEYVEYLLECANKTTEGSATYRAFERRLEEIRALPHTEGCKGKDSMFLCNCGQYRADRWVSNQS